MPTGTLHTAFTDTRWNPKTREAGSYALAQFL